MSLPALMAATGGGGVTGVSMTGCKGIRSNQGANCSCLGCSITCVRVRGCSYDECTALHAEMHRLLCLRAWPSCSCTHLLAAGQHSPQCRSPQPHNQGGAQPACAQNTQHIFKDGKASGRTSLGLPGGCSITQNQAAGQSHHTRHARKQAPRRTSHELPGRCSTAAVNLSCRAVLLRMAAVPQCC
jgi:hypothetical protein